MMGTNKTPEEKITELQMNINYYCYMRIIANNFTEKQLCELYDEIFDNNTYCNGQFSIDTDARGEKYEVKDSSIEVWVNQTRNGGYTGDDFAGDIYVKLNDKEWLTWGYDC